MKKFWLPLLLTIALPVSVAAEDKDWEFMIEPYVLATSIEGDAGLGRVADVPVDVDFSTILDSLDIGAMVHLEAIRDQKWGVIVDFGFMDLSGGTTVARNGVLEADVYQGVLETFVFRRIQSGSQYFDLYGGLRWWNNDIGVNLELGPLQPRRVKIKEDWVDPVVGGRWHHPINEKWKLVLRGDIGGFGIESDWTAAAGVSLWRQFESLSMEFAYRGTWVDYESGIRGEVGSFAYDTLTHGPMVGLAWTF
ncbi:conserved hypothetical protein [Luminiphilus syltensis NOR5-1B]|uniref:Outer membrane protein beta-barrel domain-containing protein n=1 Tax=Luminiphilus syltensis NOR5-1B TaxID=565045 RepID=B8KRP7_9GAMM|nr:hypothetical protein [Luminiphilus syltensis]EED36007.1 conserved hypothetical protein [Luminiphilus syltensis NOR5-1B]